MELPNPRFTSIRPGILIRCSLPIRDNSGSITHWKGTRMATEKAVKMIVLVLVL